MPDHQPVQQQSPVPGGSGFLIDLRQPALGVPEVRALVVIRLAGGLDQQGCSCFRKKFLLIEIAKLPDEM